ncbi:MAG: hypothetical protein ACTHMV_10390 [Chitinophagaceae bacterium]
MRHQYRYLLLLAILQLASTVSNGQYIYRIKADTVVISNDSCNAELVIKNSTKDVNGFLYNLGNGRTEFRPAAINSPYQSLTDQATIVWDYSDGSSKSVVLEGNRILSILNAQNGSQGRLIVKQDATGNRRLTLPAGSLILTSANQNTALSTVANSVDLLTWSFDGTNYFWTIQSTFNPSFRPSDFTNLACWYRSDTAITLSGSDVVSWEDISGNSRHLNTVTTGARPVIQTNQLNGYPAIYGDGTKHLRTATTFPVFTTLTAYIVARQEDGDNEYGVFVDADYDKGWHIRRYLTHSQMLAGADSYTLPFGARQSASNNIFYTIRLRSNGTTSFISLNNNAETSYTEANRTIAPTALTLFSDPNNYYFGKKKIVEIIVYTEDHNESKRVQIEEYLKRRYGHY